VSSAHTKILLRVRFSSTSAFRDKILNKAMDKGKLLVDIPFYTTALVKIYHALSTDDFAVPISLVLNRW